MRLHQAARTERDQTAQRRDSPAWWLRSGYIEQVADIAPLQLLDRQVELDELDDWCTTGSAAYIWWQAPPRAGKSALMAWFTLHPPPGVWVVSFFVTARLAAQADSIAFTGGLLDQLAAVAGEQLPPVAEPMQCDRLRRQLLTRAVARAAKNGRRLVLLVDGLDEDCGSQPGSGLASIAASLPKRPPEGLRVIVAGRPDPPIPADVDTDHPLRTCKVRVLEASPHARRVTELAQQELDEVLNTDPARHDGLGFQALGLVTASGGGLDRDDLQQLTGRPGFAIDRLLRGVFGRTVAGRTNTYTNRPVYLFTHETLREQAIDRLGPRTLAEFEDRIHTWADTYRTASNGRPPWPDNTPPYLLRDYPGVLRATGDSDRLVALATDPVRHDRMFNLTGGDGAALAEIRTAQNLILTHPAPDLLAMARLSIHLHHVTDRNTHVPVDLPAVWAKLGHSARGTALAHAMANPWEQARAMARLVAALGQSDQFDSAETLAQAIAVPRWRAEALIDLAKALSAAGQNEHAEQLVDTANTADPDRHSRHIVYGQDWWDEHRRELALATLVEALVAADGVEHAETVAHSTNQYSHRQALVALVDALASANNADLARRLADHVAGADNAATSTSDTTLSVRRKKTLVEDLDDRFSKAMTFIDLVEAMSATGDLPRAVLVANIAEALARDTWGGHRDGFLGLLAVARAAAGDIDGAFRLAISIHGDVDGVGVFARMARRVAQAGNPEGAHTLIGTAERAAGLITDLIRTTG